MTRRTPGGDHLGDRIPVEPLDDIRLTNIERRIVLGASDALAAQPVRRSARLGVGFGIAAVAAAAMAAGVIGWKLHEQLPTDVDDRSLALHTAPVTMQTSTESSTLDIGDAIIASDAGTQFAITRPDGKVLVTLASGRVELEVAKRNGGPPLIVHAGDTDVIVVGTHFSVDFDGAGEVGVHVTEGIVRVERLHGEVRVTAGQAWSAKRGVVAFELFPEPPGRVHLDAKGHVVADAGGVIGEVAMRAASGSGYDIDTSGVPDVLKNRAAVVPDPAVVHRPHHTSSDGPGSNASVVATDTIAVQPANPHADVMALIRSKKIVPAQDVGAVTGEAAMANYRETSTREKGNDAAYALYSMAVTQHLKLGRNADALSTIDAFVRRFNGGDYYEPALWLRVRVTCLQSIDDRCRGAAQVYLSRAPSGPMASIAELITMTGEP